MVGARSGGTRMPWSRLARTLISPTGSPAWVARLQDLDLGPHLAQGLDQADAVGIEPDAGQQDVGVRQDQGGDQGKGGGGGIGRHLDAPAHQLGLADQSDHPAFRCIRDPDLGPEMAEHQLGMVAGRLGLDDRGLAGRIQPRQQDRRFDLGRGDRQAIADRQRIAGALDGQRQAVAFPRGEGRTHLGEGGDDVGHGPPAQGGIAGEEGGQPVGRHHPHEEARTGAGIAEIEHIGGLAEAPDAAPDHAPDARLVAPGLGPQGAAWRRRCAAHPRLRAGHGSRSRPRPGRPP